VVVKRDANLAQFPQAKLLVTGFVRYEITGGKYVYREFKVAENEYEGIPRPSDEEAVRIVKQHLADFLRGPFNSMVNTDKIKLEFARPDEQKWVWHSPESVEFRVRVSYDTIVSATEVASIQSVWDARLYRDKVDQPWQRITGSERTRTEVSRRKYTAKQIRDLPTGLAR